MSCSYMIAAEQKARTTYDNILRMVKDPEVCDPIRFLRKREIIHFQRFGEVLRNVQDHLNSKNFYAFNPSFDIPQGPRCKAPAQQNTQTMVQQQNPAQANQTAMMANNYTRTNTASMR
jgi:Mn-containing catalase